MNLYEVMCTKFLVGKKPSNTAGMNLQALLGLQSTVSVWQSLLDKVSSLFSNHVFQRTDLVKGNCPILGPYVKGAERKLGLVNSGSTEHWLLGNTYKLRHSVIACDCYCKMYRQTAVQGQLVVFNNFLLNLLSHQKISKLCAYDASNQQCKNMFTKLKIKKTKTMYCNTLQSLVPKHVLNKIPGPSLLVCPF